MAETPAPLLRVADARARILARLSPLPAEWLGLDAALGRVLATDIVARRTQPPAAVSAMDGYAVIAADTEAPGRRLRVVGENRAGLSAVARMGRGEAVRIFTGARLPAGADAVVLEENAVLEDRGVSFTRPSRAAEFVRPAGLDFEAGAVLVPAGTVLGPRSLGLVAATGHAWLAVRRQPRVGLIATGDELVRPGELPDPDQIPSSNAVTLAHLVRSWGGMPVDLGIARDTRVSLAETLERARGLDLLVTIGGASIGQYDIVRPTLAGLGLELEFWRLAMRPGKPMMFGTLAGTPVLGLPGNAVSATVCAILFLRAAMLALLGLPPGLPMVRARSAAPLPANDEREDYLRAFRVAGDGPGLWLESAPRQDSSMLRTLAAADALIVRAPRAPAAVPGDDLEAILLAEVERLARIPATPP